MTSAATLAEKCDRICGKYARFHKDRCPLYKANCEAMDAMNTFARCERCDRGKLPDSRRVCMACRMEEVRG